MSSPRAFAYLQLAVDERFIWNTTSFDATLDTPGLWGSPIEFAATAAGLYPDNLDIIQASVNDTDIWERLDVGQVSLRLLRVLMPFVSIEPLRMCQSDPAENCTVCSGVYADLPSRPDRCDRGHERNNGIAKPTIHPGRCFCRIVSSSRIFNPTNIVVHSLTSRSS